MRPLFDAQSSNEYDLCLVCPVCNESYLHQRTVKVQNRAEDSHTGSVYTIQPSGKLYHSTDTSKSPLRRQSMQIEFECEHCHASGEFNEEEFGHFDEEEDPYMRVSRLENQREPPPPFVLQIIQHKGSTYFEWLTSSLTPLHEQGCKTAFDETVAWLTSQGVEGQTHTVLGGQLHVDTREFSGIFQENLLVFVFAEDYPEVDLAGKIGAETKKTFDKPMNLYYLMPYPISEKARIRMLQDFEAIQRQPHLTRADRYLTFERGLPVPKAVNYPRAKDSWACKVICKPG